MKQRIISATIRLTLLLAAVAGTVACRVDKGNENVDTTASGYMLFNNANDAVHEFSQAIDRLQGLDLYIAAADDATREAIRNRFFHDKRIVADAEHEGRWHILSNTTSMTVDTGRRRLGDEGAAWSYSYSDTDYAGGERPTLRRTAQNRYTFRMPSPANATAEIIYAVADALEVELMFEPDDPLQGYSTITLKGRFTSVCGYGSDKLVLETEITDPIIYSAQKSGVTAGVMELDGLSRGSIERASARYLTPHTVDIEYGGAASTWVY